MLTQDGHLVARHEPNIMNTTNVQDHPEFASRRRTAIIDGAQDEGWFVSDFTLAEIKTLRAVQAFPLVDANDVNPDGTLDFTTPFDRPYDWTASGHPQLLARRFDFLVTDEGLREVREYADGIGPWKRYIVSTAAGDLNDDGVIGDENGDGQINEADRQLLPPTDLIQRAHAHGLLVHTWTSRNEQFRLPSDYQGNPVNEYLQFYDLGIDGVFSDFTDTAFAARVLFQLSDDPDFTRCLTGDRHSQRHHDCLE